MESHLRFLLTHVKFGNQMRFQVWFVRKFLCGPNSETLVADIVRFICCGHHPPNNVIISDVIQRWAVIGWLLKCYSKNYVEANVKLALFYDWLFFDERLDDIMDIEPAILLMVNSIPQYVDMTENLLEFLFLLIDFYDVKRRNIIIQSVSSALDVLVRKGVIQLLDILTSCDMISPFLKETLNKLVVRKQSDVSKDFHPLSSSWQSKYAEFRLSAFPDEEGSGKTLVDTNSKLVLHKSRYIWLLVVFLAMKICLYVCYHATLPEKFQDVVAASSAGLVQKNGQ